MHQGEHATRLAGQYDRSWPYLSLGISKTSPETHALAGHLRCLEPGAAFEELKNLRSIGLNKDIRKIMEEGPPDSFPAQFHKLFNEKEAQTALDADDAMSALGWA